MVPTGPDDESPVDDGPGDAGSPAVPADGFETFLSAVRGMVHGDDAPVVQHVDEPAVDEVAQPDVSVDPPSDPDVVPPGP